MFGCENVKPILNSHHAQIILPLLGLCNVMPYVFWQRSRRVLHLSPACLSKAAHTEHTAAFMARSYCGRKCFASQENVHRCRQAQAHTEKHISGTVLGNHYQSGTKPSDQGKFSSLLSSSQNLRHSSLRGRVRQLHLLSGKTLHQTTCSHCEKLHRRLSTGVIWGF